MLWLCQTITVWPHVCVQAAVPDCANSHCRGLVFAAERATAVAAPSPVRAHASCPLAQPQCVCRAVTRLDAGRVCTEVAPACDLLKRPKVAARKIDLLVIIHTSFWMQSCCPIGCRRNTPGRPCSWRYVVASRGSTFPNSITTV